MLGSALSESAEFPRRDAVRGPESLAEVSRVTEPARVGDIVHASRGQSGVNEQLPGPFQPPPGDPVGGRSVVSAPPHRNELASRHPVGSGNLSRREVRVTEVLVDIGGYARRLGRVQHLARLRVIADRG